MFYLAWLCCAWQEVEGLGVTTRLARRRGGARGRERAWAVARRSVAGRITFSGNYKLGTGLKLCHQGYQKSKRNLVYEIWSHHQNKKLLEWCINETGGGWLDFAFCHALIPVIPGRV